LEVRALIHEARCVLRRFTAPSHFFLKTRKVAEGRLNVLMTRDREVANALLEGAAAVGDARFLKKIQKKCTGEELRTLDLQSAAERIGGNVEAFLTLSTYPGYSELPKKLLDDVQEIILRELISRVFFLFLAGSLLTGTLRFMGYSWLEKSAIGMTWLTIASQVYYCYLLIRPHP
jgi:hypothetical protein